MMNNYFVLSYAGHNLTLPSITYLVLFIILSVIVNAIAIYLAADLVTKSSTAGKALFVAIIALDFTLLTQFLQFFKSKFSFTSGKIIESIGCIIKVRSDFDTR